MFRMEIYTSVERNQALAGVREALGSSEGWIVHHQLFSNKSASIVFEMPAEKIQPFMDLLEAAGLKGIAEGDVPTGNRDITGTIAITFIHDEPDMKRDVPAFG